MTLPDTEDLILFGSLGLLALGAALVTVASTHDGLLAVGVACVVFAVPSFLVTFMAAGEPE